MKAVVVYYSLEGNTDYVAQEMKKQLGADLIRVEAAKKYPTGKMSKFIWGGKSVIFGEEPELVPYTFDETAYDLIIIGTPVWASNFAPPLKTFLKEHVLKNKRIALVACSSGGDVSKCFDKLKNNLKDCEIVSTLSLVDPLVRKKEEDLKAIDTFCKQLS